MRERFKPGDIIGDPQQVGQLNADDLAKLHAKYETTRRGQIQIFMHTNPASQVQVHIHVERTKDNNRILKVLSRRDEGS